MANNENALIIRQNETSNNNEVPFPVDKYVSIFTFQDMESQLNSYKIKFKLTFGRFARTTKRMIVASIVKALANGTSTCDAFQSYEVSLELP